jgi:hypothetical protein
MTSVLSSSSPNQFLTDLLAEKSFQYGTTVGNQPAMHNDNAKGHLNASTMHTYIVDDDAKGHLNSATMDTCSVVSDNNRNRAYDKKSVFFSKMRRSSTSKQQTRRYSLRRFVSSIWPFTSSGIGVPSKKPLKECNTQPTNA